MDLGLKGKKALITGGANGIGRAMLEDFAKEGVQLVFTSRKEEGLAEALEAIGGESAGHKAYVSPISDEGEPKRLADKIKAEFGDLDIVVNNVGHTLEVTDPFCSIQDWRAVMRLNFEVAVEINNEFLPFMQKQKWGRILNITSCAGLENSGPVTFSAAKAALTAYTRSTGRVLAMESPGVVMSALSPGIVLTKGGHWEKVLKERPEHAEKYIKDRAPIGRFGDIFEISPMALLLCSEKASFCHGAIVPVDAGQSRHYMYFNYLD